MALKFIFLLYFCFCSAVAGELPLEQLSGQSDSFVSEPVFCEKLADEFCQSLWSSENQGNFQFSDGTQILYGERRKNIIDNAQFIHIQKLAKSRCNLPADIKDMMGIQCGVDDKTEDLLLELDTLLSQVDSIAQNKRAIESWKKSVNRILSDLEYIIEDAAYERSFSKNPNLSEKFWTSYSVEEKKDFNTHYYDIKTEIMDAIYLNDPDWRKAVEIFEEVRADVLSVIDKMTLVPEIKQSMKEKISLIKISLPYEDPRTMYGDTSCAEYEDNAAYNLLQNSFYFCIGTINISHNEGAFYGTIAHEISHSIDPNTVLEDIFKQSPMSSLLRQVYESNASVSCKEWERQKNDIFILPSEIYQLPQGLAAIDQCLVDRDHLDELNHSSLDYVSKRTAESFIDSYASENLFSYLTTPLVFKDGVLKQNEFYLNPTLFAESENEYFEDKDFLAGYFHQASVFVQEYKCRLSQVDVTEEQAFSEALEETKRLNAIYEYYYSSILGENSRDLIEFNLSKPSDEDFADWLSYKAVELKLQRIQALQRRRDFILSGMATYCSPEGLENIAKHKILIEKKYSRNFHSPNRDRRLRNFTSKTADLLQCTRGEDITKLDKNCDFLLQ